MLNEIQFKALTELLPWTVIVQDSEGNLTFPKATPEEMILINSILATFDPEEAIQQHKEWLSTNASLLIEGRQWFKDHPNAKDLFLLSMDDIDTKIEAWDLSNIPSPTRGELKLTIRALICSVRIFAARLKLID